MSLSLMRKYMYFYIQMLWNKTIFSLTKECIFLKFRKGQCNQYLSILWFLHTISTLQRNPSYSCTNYFYVQIHCWLFDWYLQRVLDLNSLCSQIPVTCYKKMISKFQYNIFDLFCQIKCTCRHFSWLIYL